MLRAAKIAFISYADVVLARIFSFSHVYFMSVPFFPS